jgi:hypothetical protein|tara:strand:- start:825 stop:1223 length:399 start_codon:yes stop_codon:yes gene_type:complete
MSLVDIVPPEQAGTSKLEIEFHEQALAEFNSTERDSDIWAIVCDESAENLKPLNLKGEAYTKAYDEAAKRLYVKLRANTFLKGYILLKWVNRIIWISVFSLLFLGSLSAFIGGAFEGFEPRALFDQLLQQLS